LGASGAAPSAAQPARASGATERTIDIARLFELQQGEGGD
jgi:hypothetical protein